MEIDEHLKYTLYVMSFYRPLLKPIPIRHSLTVSLFNSLQFDPCPRAGEPMVSRRTPDYFL